MTLFRLITSLRRYGLKGIYDWVRRTWRPSEDPLVHSLQSHIDATFVPTRGVTIIGGLTSHTSLGKVLRDFECSLKEIGIPYQIYDTETELPDDFVLNRYTDIVTMFSDLKISGLSRCRQHRIIFWEFDTGFIKAHPECIDGTPLLAMSSYCHELLRRQVHPRTVVEYIRYPFHFSAQHIIDSKIRQKFNIPANAFMVFFNFDYRSSYYRKNPEGLLQAFLEAFIVEDSLRSAFTGRADLRVGRDRARPSHTDHNSGQHNKNGDDAVLVFKTIGSRVKKEVVDRLKTKISHANAEGKVIFIDDFISNEELVSLTAACDVYASLHRGEGFGLGVAEAMSMGKPVVVSDCGATREFCTSDTAELIPCKIVPVKPEQIDHPSYTWVTEWPEPDVHAAAVALRKLYDNPDLRRQLGENGRQFISHHFSAEEVGKSIVKLFQASEV